VSELKTPKLYVNYDLLSILE